jgi:hypothetical protein
MLSRSFTTTLHRHGAAPRRALQATIGRFQNKSTASSAVESGNNKGPIAADGRHEVWREGIYDHDNEPK